jgi:colanic acid/amylovoran biosynthesis glycosyltransferase
VRHGESGWLFPAGDVDELVLAITSCLSATPEALSRMASAAHVRVLERHDVDTEAAKLAALFAQSGARA